jgi:hypothetical protein
MIQIGISIALLTITAVILGLLGVWDFITKNKK